MWRSADFFEAVIEYVTERGRTVAEAYIAAELDASVGTRLVIVTGDLEKVPDAKCVQARLPKGRRPARHEVEEAFAACRLSGGG